MKRLHGFSYSFHLALPSCNDHKEHLHFNDEFEHTGGIDLYMPIAPKESISRIEKEIVYVEPVRTVNISFGGENTHD